MDITYLYSITGASLTGGSHDIVEAAKLCTMLTFSYKSAIERKLRQQANYNSVHTNALKYALYGKRHTHSSKYCN